jgi:multimeric flavodoxin WrbA
MKATIYDGFDNHDADCRQLIQAVTAQLEEAGYEIDFLTLKDMKIGYCTGCFGCWIKTPGVCVLNDEGRAIAKSGIESDLVVALTPVTFGGYSSSLKKALDRWAPNLSPFFETRGGEIHHKRRYDHYADTAIIGLLRSPDDEAEKVFESLAARNKLNFFGRMFAGGVVTAGDDLPAQVGALLGQVLKAGVEK